MGSQLCQMFNDTCISDPIRENFLPDAVRVKRPSNFDWINAFNRQWLSENYLHGDFELWSMHCEPKREMFQNKNTGPHLRFKS